MMNRIVVNVIYQPCEILLIINNQPPERRLEQTSCPVILVIESFGIGVKKIAKLLCRIVFFLLGINYVFLACFGFYKTNFFRCKYPDQEMKMVFHQHPGEGFGYRGDMFGIQPKKVYVVGFFPEKGFAVVTTVVNVVICVVF